MVLESPVLLENDTDKFVLYSELHTAFEQALEQIPGEVSGPFRLNRFDGLTYKEIAKKLGVSVRTVEVRISKTLYHLREKLKDYLMLTVLFLGLNML
jgi:RNA polymerase sigma-70 factor (ECF subfamily)